MLFNIFTRKVFSEIPGDLDDSTEMNWSKNCLQIRWKGKGKKIKRSSTIISKTGERDQLVPSPHSDSDSDNVALTNDEVVKNQSNPSALVLAKMKCNEWDVSNKNNVNAGNILPASSPRITRTSAPVSQRRIPQTMSRTRSLNSSASNHPAFKSSLFDESLNFKQTKPSRYTRFTNNGNKRFFYPLQSINECEEPDLDLDLNL